jgi:integrase/recombinase XerD
MKLKEVVDQFLLDCSNRRRADGTLALYARVLGLLVRWLEGVTLALLRQFLHYLLTSDSNQRFPNAVLKGKLAPVTVGTYIAVIKAFFHWCVIEDLLETNPAVRLAKPKVSQKVVTTFTPEHLDKLLATCDTSTQKGFRDYVMLLVLLDTGMRVSEFCNLRLSDVHPHYVKVFGKGRKEREIGLHPEVSKLLWKYIHKYRVAKDPQEDCVFLGKYGALTVRGVEGIVKLVKQKSGISDVRVTPHTFRHTFAKWYLKRGGDLFKLSRELGHSGVQVTGQIYLGDFHSTDARQDHESFSPIGDLKRAGAKKRLGRLKDK